MAATYQSTSPAVTCVACARAGVEVRRDPLARLARHHEVVRDHGVGQLRHGQLRTGLQQGGRAGVLAGRRSGQERARVGEPERGGDLPERLRAAHLVAHAVTVSTAPVASG